MARLRIIRDRDGDGIRDYIEKQRWRMVKGDGSTFTLDPFPDEVVRTPVGLAIAAGSADVLVASYELADARGTTTRNELVTATAATYEDTAVGDVTLPVGASVTASSALVGETSRGYSWEYIQREVPGVTQDQMGEILRTPSAVVTTGSGSLVIGDNPGGEGQLIIELVGGTVVKAYSGQAIRDPQGRRVIIDRNERHPLQDDNDHPDSYDEIEEVIKNPDEIWESGRRVYYVKEINGRYLVIRTYREGSVWTISTAVYEGSKLQDVRDLLRRKGFNIPGDRVF